MSGNNTIRAKIYKALRILKLLFLTVIRHYFPSHRKLIYIYKKLRQEELPLITIANGKIRGKLGKNINNGLYYSFQGIPYAKPPIGHLRFRAPQPAEPWSGVLDATHERDDCISRHSFMRTLIGSEYCLNLNVYTPKLPNDKKNDVLPVMFWIHGGGFTSGSGSTEVYGPEILLTGDVVLVTINYRTAVYGFLSLDDPDLDVPGNAGLKDMVIALKWVQKNIAYFGGDSNNVTIFGESAGAAAVHYLILSPLAKGLFHKAILQSGCALNVWAKGRNYSEEIAKTLGLKSADERVILKTLQEMTVEEIYRKLEKIPDPFIASINRPHGPVIERKSPGAFLSEDPISIIKSGNYNKVPMMLGFTSREGMLGEIIQRPRPFKPITDFETAIPHFLNIKPGTETSKAVAQHIKEFYYGDQTPTSQNKQSYYLLQTDNFFVREILSTINYHIPTLPHPIFLYKMSIETSLNFLKNIYQMSEPGVCHADDLGYLFKNLLTPEIEPQSHEDIAVKRFVKFWTNFARSGDPNPRTLNSLINVKWKPVQKDAVNYIEIDKELKSAANPEAEMMVFWRKICEIGGVNI